MRITVLSDNLPARGLEAEWGLSLYLEYQGHALLLDTGASDLFARNAEALGLDLGAVAFGVLSHAHWDHANGMDAFFARNPSAPFYLQASCGEVCFDHAPGLWRYEGPRRGLLDRFAPRLRYVTRAFSPLPGVHLLPHTTPGLARRGEAAGMFCLRAGQWVPDDFSHEQTLVLETPRGLVLLSSCCHAGGHHHPGGPSCLPRPAHSGHRRGLPPLRDPGPGGPGPGPPPSGHRGGPGPHRPLHRGERVCPAPGGIGGASCPVLHRAGGRTVR